VKTNIIGTGSAGNAILLCDSVLIDVGLPYKDLSKYAQEIKIVLLTHIHGDHFNRSSIRKLYIENENIRFCCGDFLEQNLIDLGISKNRIIVLERGKKYNLGDVIFSPVFLQHDVKNFGYRVMQNGHKHFHATDASNLEGISAENYNSATVEANHDLLAATKIIEEKNLSGEFCHLNRAIKTHLSVDKAIKFITDNNIETYYPVHIGGLTRREVDCKLNSPLPFVVKNK